MPTKTFCPLPWIHLATRPNGDVRVCCTANASGAGETDDKTAGLVKKDGIAMNLRDHTVPEIWNSDHMKQTRLQMLNGEIPSSCTKCFQEEEKGLISKRQWETDEWRKKVDFIELVDKTGEDGSLPVEIPYFDLRLGNTCQLKCSMCSPHDSSSWIKEWKLMYPQYEDEQLKQDQDWNEDFDYVWYKRSDFLDFLREHIPNIKQLYFAGGEPLMIQEHWDILRDIVAMGYSKDIKLRYNSNGVPGNSKIKSKAANYFNMFKDVRFNMSIDAYGHKNDYIRYPSRWTEVEDSLHYFAEELDKAHTVNVACAVQALNVLYLDELVDWLDGDYAPNTNKRTHMQAPIMGMHLVYLPSYMNIRVLPIEIKNMARRKIEDLIFKRRNDPYFVGHPLGQKRWEGIIKYMYAEDWSHKQPALVNYLETLDKNRGTNWRTTFPELGEYL